MCIRDFKGLMELPGLEWLCKLPRKFLWIIWGSVLLLGVTACAQADPGQPPSATPTAEQILTPYRTATPTPGEGSRGLATRAPTKIPLPTPTPFIYTVVENDTLTGIAFRYSVPLDDLITANPGLDPSFLTIGMTLTVPLEGAEVSTLPTATPIPMNLQLPVCYRRPDQKLQCLVEVENPQPFAVENVALQVSLLSAEGDILGTLSAVPPLNWIPSGKSVVVSAVFPSTPDQAFRPEASLLTVIPLEAESQRYLEADIQVQEARFYLDAAQVQLQGTISLSAEQPEASIVWILALAYDENDQIVGFRKWVGQESLAAEGMMDFEMSVYSLGPSIQRFDIVTEIRP